MWDAPDTDAKGVNAELEQQISQNQLEIEAKRKDLYAERLNIERSHGAQQWLPPKP